MFVREGSSAIRCRHHLAACLLAPVFTLRSLVCRRTYDNTRKGRRYCPDSALSCSCRRDNRGRDIPGGGRVGEPCASLAQQDRVAKPAGLLSPPPPTTPPAGDAGSNPQLSRIVELARLLSGCSRKNKKRLRTPDVQAEETLTTMHARSAQRDTTFLHFSNRIQTMLTSCKPLAPAVVAPQRRSVTRASVERPGAFQRVGQLGAALAASLALVSPAMAEIRLPPIDKGEKY